MPSIWLYSGDTLKRAFSLKWPFCRLACCQGQTDIVNEKTFITKSYTRYYDSWVCSSKIISASYAPPTLKESVAKQYFKILFYVYVAIFFYNQYFKNGLFIDIWNKYLTSMVVGYRCASPRITQFRNPDIFAYNAFHLRESASLDSKSSSWMICIERSRNISAWIFTYLKQFLQSFSVVVSANLFSQNTVQ